MAEWVSGFFELAMLVIFGSSWPFAIHRTYTAKRVDGKSPHFMVLVILGYLCGILSHLVVSRGVWICWVYLLDIALVMTDLSLYMIYARRNRK